MSQHTFMYHSFPLNFTALPCPPTNTHPHPAALVHCLDQLLCHIACSGDPGLCRSALQMCEAFQARQQQTLWVSGSAGNLDKHEIEEEVHHLQNLLDIKNERDGMFLRHIKRFISKESFEYIFPRLQQIISMRIRFAKNDQSIKNLRFDDSDRLDRLRREIQSHLLGKVAWGSQSDEHYDEWDLVEEAVRILWGENLDNDDVYYPRGRRPREDK